jgi:hypothetical protein
MKAVVQRKCGCGGSCGPCGENRKKVQRRALGPASSEIPQSVESTLHAPGQPLDGNSRGAMESHFGRDFSGVRVHTDAHAAAPANAIDAAAYTSGSHIVFAANRFEPSTPAGHRLLAHELAHVVQQKSGTSLREGIAPADDPHEHEADRMAEGAPAQPEGGRALDSSLASRMGRVFSRNFSRVRVHTDAAASSRATRLNARAFTIGNDITFAHGHYNPGTLVGDALVAHELAHVAQQDGARGPLAKKEPGAPGGPLERDADTSAVHAMLALVPALRTFARGVRRNAMPQLRSGLQLQRCLLTGCGEEEQKKKVEDPNACQLMKPENCPTYESWIATIPISLVRDDNTLADQMPAEVKALITTPTSTNGGLPDCADTSMILRHYYLKAHGKSTSFLVGRNRKTASTFTLGKKASDAQVRECMIGAGTQSFQEDRTGFALVDFYKTKGKPTTNLKQLLTQGLKPGDMFIKKRVGGPGGFEGHAQTVREVTLPTETTEGRIVFVQGNMHGGLGGGQLQQRVKTFKELTGREDGDADIVPDTTNYEVFFGAGPWKGPSE